MQRYFKIAGVLLISILIILGALRYTAESTQPPQTISITERSYYEPLSPFMLKDVSMQASIADTPEERALGLSNTTELPSDIAKVFIFPYEDKWSFWMKDMQYPIDIIWVAADGEVVHVEDGVAPETYPSSFTPLRPALFVIETIAGFSREHSIGVGDQIDISPFLD